MIEATLPLPPEPWAEGSGSESSAAGGAGDASAGERCAGHECALGSSVTEQLLPAVSGRLREGTLSPVYKRKVRI
jgi:hypothetical protein